MEVLWKVEELISLAVPHGSFVGVPEDERRVPENGK